MQKIETTKTNKERGDVISLEELGLGETPLPKLPVPEELIHSLLDMPHLISTSQSLLFEQIQVMEDIEEHLKAYETESFLKISGEKDENGKLLHTNEKLREIAMQKDLSANQVYDKYWKAKKVCREKLEFAKQNLERYQLMSKIKLETLRYLTSINLSGGK
jgi:hypothetical protein